jgi:hypothetical protein
MKSREMQQEKQAREHRLQMDLRRSAFKDRYKHVYQNGMTGVSIV